MSTRIGKGALVLASLGFAFSLGCQSTAKKADAQNPNPGPPPIMSAVAHLKGTRGHHRVAGIVTFTQLPNGVRVVADIHGLKHHSVHGFHIHEFGDCSAPDASSAGGHFNPTNKSHGSPTDLDHHMGDFGNVTADRKGHVHFEQDFIGLAISGPDGIMGKSVILHAKPDDLKSQPSGNAGARIGCGTIEAQ